MYERQTIYEHRNIVSIIMLGPLVLTDDVLVDDLEAVIMYLLFINQHDFF